MDHNKSLSLQKREKNREMEPEKYCAGSPDFPLVFHKVGLVFGCPSSDLVMVRHGLGGWISARLWTVEIR